MKIAICEDEKICSDILEGYIKKWANESGIFVEIFSYSSAEQFLFALEDNTIIDILFLDIRMGKMNGIELAHELRNFGYQMQIIFTTNLKEYAFEGYNVSALNYLMKPIEYSDCLKTLNRAKKQLTTKKFYLCKTSGVMQKILYEDILYIEMVSHDAIITTLTTTYRTRKTATSILMELNDDLFIRCHKSFIINIQHVNSISKKSITLSNGVVVDASSNYVTEVNERFIKYNKDRRW